MKHKVLIYTYIYIYIYIYVPSKTLDLYHLESIIISYKYLYIFIYLAASYVVPKIVRFSLTFIGKRISTQSIK